MNSTVDDVTASVADGRVTPVIVLVAVGASARGQVIPVDGEVGLGRTAAIDDERMSRDHARVRYERGAWVITDRGSHNGTFVDGGRITAEVRRRGDCVLRLGHSVFLLIGDGRDYDGPLPPGEHIVGPELARVYDEVRRHAAAATLLVHGESGSGKELIARLYHNAGPRSDGPFVAVNCAAIPEGVAERLLFGSRKGAFSGATDAVGYLQNAHGGTLFLDEIADLDAGVQAKLLRALELREVTPVGATGAIAIDIGVVAASHRDLRAEVAARRFRDDLYYRLARASVAVPPLRARKWDIARLVVRELGGMAAHARLIETCCVRPWPGNVRELLAAIALAVGAAQAAGRAIVRPEDLPAHAGLPVSEDRTPDERASATTLDKAAILEALAQANGVVSAAARALGLHRTQLYRLMDKHGIARTE